MKNIKETIQLLNHIQEKPEATQRELVKKLDVSLGKVNFLIKALVGKGVIKLKRFKNSKDKIAYLYIVTPKGVAERTRILKLFLAAKLEEYDRVKREVEVLKTEVSKIK
jgi:MarR family transcriptional regulator, temperature-dependent positive regulator of motility